jgi:hypothetical protein
MATLLLTAVGTVIGGPLGGAIGALVGRQVDAAIFGGRTVEGPRLKELAVQTSSYGSALPLHFGTMRTAGSVIWATDLVEHRKKQGGGKGRPSVTSYTYTSSFAVALGSRPIGAVGRIWADGNLLRGAAGDLKVGGSLRFHSGHGDQVADPVIVQAEGAAFCPGFRGTAYAVFEDLELAEFGNRIPSLTFEVFGDPAGTTVANVVHALAPDAAIEGLDVPMTGFTIDRGTVGDSIATLAQAFPLSCNAWGEHLAISGGEVRRSGLLPVLPEPARSRDDSEPGHLAGTSGKRAARPKARVCALRYYDTDRDYQPSVQRGRGRASPGDIAVTDLPAALSAETARDLAEKASRRSADAREGAHYRITTIDGRFSPGAIVAIPSRAGAWRVEQWEWQADGVDLSLTRLPPQPAFSNAAGDPGRANLQADLISGPTRLVAFELPWDGTGSGLAPSLFAATSSATSGWSGAALLAQQPGGVVTELGATGRRRAVIGRVPVPTAASSPLLVDFSTVIEVQLFAADQALNEAGFAQLAAGANKALVGSEVIQFAHAEPVGEGRWRLSGLLRGRGGTEPAIYSHAPDEDFVLLDDALVPLDPLVVGDAAHVMILAAGAGDPTPVSAAISCAGVTLRPLAPVHGSARRLSNGDVEARWLRRARGAWNWPDQTDAPLHEESELWDVRLVSGAVLFAMWRTGKPNLVIPAGDIASAPAGSLLEIRQVGRSALSLPLILAVPL